MTRTRIDKAKQTVRERVWQLLEQEQAVLPPGVYGRIPNFLGADTATALLTTLPEWQEARTIMATPDKAQLPARTSALAENKHVYMAVPKLAAPHPFSRLVPPAPHPLPEDASSLFQQAKLRSRIFPVIDLVICGSVAVNRYDTRIGKGAGYFDIELALLQEASLLRPQTTILTTVHPLQVLNEPLPTTAHDFSIDLIITPDEIITCHPPQRPKGLIWEHLTKEKIAAIPALADRAPQHPT